MTALAPVEASALAQHEATVERGLASFLDVGRALLAIRDDRLYRVAFTTFEDYCQQRWGIDRTYAFRLTQAAQVADVLPVGNTPANEAQARELAPLLDQPERLRETWQQVNEQTGGKPTAAAIRTVVRPMTYPSRHPDGTAKVTETVKTETVVNTATGEVVGHLPIEQHPDYRDDPNVRPWRPAPPTPAAEADLQREVSRQAWSQNLARWSNALARLAPDADNARGYAEDFLPEHAISHGGVSRQTLQDAARFLLALADVWKDEAA